MEIKGSWLLVCRGGKSRRRSAYPAMSPPKQAGTWEQTADAYLYLARG